MVQLFLTEISDEESPAANAQTIELEEMSNTHQSDHQVKRTKANAYGMCTIEHEFMHACSYRNWAGFTNNKNIIEK